MYRRKIILDVGEPKFAEDLHALGLEVTTDGQVLTTDGKHIEPRLHRSERLHYLHWEGIRAGVRKFVADKIAEHGIQTVYLVGDSMVEDAEENSEELPASIPILISNVDTLKHKSSVIVVVGESTEDPGIFSHWDAVHDTGIYNASLLALLRRLDKWPTKAGTSDALSTNEQTHITHAGSQLGQETPPGLVVLNPGQLIYCRKEKKTFTQRSWLNRPLRAEQLHSDVIDPRENLIEGHRTAIEHITTCFEYILPTLVSGSASLCIIAVGDGAGNTVKVLDDMFMDMADHTIQKQLGQIFLIQPTHGHDELRSTTLKDHLKLRGRSFVLSEQPRYTLVQSVLSSPREKQIPTTDPTASAIAVNEDDGQPRWPTTEPPEGWSMPKVDNLSAQSEAYDYTQEAVSCPTYSVGPDVQHVNAILPTIMPHILDLIAEQTTKK